MTENIQAYLDVLRDNKEESKPEITQKGAVILKYLQSEPDAKTWKAKEVAEALGITSRGASGSLRSLVNNGFCEKVAENPSVYTLTEKGKNYIIKENEE